MWSDREFEYAMMCWGFVASGKSQIKSIGLTDLVIILYRLREISSELYREDNPGLMKLYYENEKDVEKVKIEMLRRVGRV